MLSLTCKTAIKAVIYLASKIETGTKAGIKEIAAYIDASEHTVGKVLQTLVKEKVINSQKGPSGGFYITPKQFTQPIIKIVVAIDGKDVFNQCGLGLTQCSAQHPCPMHDDYKAVRDQFKKMCQQKKVQDMCQPVNNGMAYLFG
ncbi:MAG: Rrf2 family transcriptional regulator [Chitinophagaceae bacterium]|nr:Rrf2 family transcriptional regulator [Chitinophagaceae bacterium]MCB0740947.1 Rrf2 family transcriptional regulator [Chitinophagaceae bacterium]HQV05312.1 Rrf2 family transcriptional regulator [Chitinophagaceae bacterium]